MDLRVFSVVAGWALALSQGAVAAKLGPGDPAPPMRVFRWVKGTPVNTFERGKLYVVEFWATWCGPCRASIPHLTQLAKKYAGKVTFSGISISESDTQKPGGTSTEYMAGVRKFVAGEGEEMAYHVGADGPTGAMGSTWMLAAGQQTIPTAFVVGREGKVAWIGHPMEGLDEALEKMIAGTFDFAGERKRELDAAAKDDPQEAERKLLQPYVSAMVEKRFKDAVAVIERISAEHPDLADTLVAAKFGALAHTDPTQAIDYAKTVAAGEAKSNPDVLNSIAWAMVDDENPLPNMDYALAEAIAAQAVALLKPDTRELANTLDTLALAQFKCGKRGDAAATEERAIAIFLKTAAKNDPEALKQMKARLTKYTQPA